MTEVINSALRSDSVRSIDLRIKQKSIYVVNNNIGTMAVKYIPDDLVAEIRNRKQDVQVFIKEAIEDKLATEEKQKKEQK